MTKPTETREHLKAKDVVDLESFEEQVNDTSGDIVDLPVSTEKEPESKPLSNVEYVESATMNIRVIMDNLSQRKGALIKELNDTASKRREILDDLEKIDRLLNELVN